MLLANISVARRIQERFPETAMLRRHPTPPETNFEQLVRAVKRLGIELKHGSSKELSDSLDKAEVSIKFLSLYCMNEIDPIAAVFQQVIADYDHAMHDAGSVFSLRRRTGRMALWSRVRYLYSFHVSYSSLR